MTDNRKPTDQMTDAELNRAIAEEKGWTLADDPFEEEDLREWANDNDWPILHIGPIASPQYWHNPNDTSILEMLPQWATDVTAALGLLREMNEAAYDPAEMTGRRYMQIYNLWYDAKEGWTVDPEFDGNWTISAPTAARAIAEAWLTLWQGQQEGDE